MRRNLRIKLLITIILTVIISITFTSKSQVQANTLNTIEEPVAGINIVLTSINNKYIEQINITYNWTTDRVNLRKEASINSDIIKTLDKRSKVEILKKTSSDWTKVKCDDDTGYVYSKYLRDTELFTSNKNKWGIDLDNKEIDLLAKILWLEARSESDNGEKAVAEVVFNRMIHMDFSDTLYEVLSDSDQFSTWDDRNTAKPTKREYENIQDVLNDETNILDFDVVYFSTKPRNDDIAAHIGRHYFCYYENER